MPTDPAIQNSERTPVVAALLSLPGVTQIGRAFGVAGIAPSSEAVDASASKIYPTSRGRRGDRGRTQARNARIRSMSAFLNQTSPSRNAYDGGGSGRENSPGAMAPATKASISVIPIGESTGPVYTDFILTGVAEQDVEKTEVVETFGAFHLFSSGRFARKYQFTGMVRAHPTNHSAGAGGVRGSGYSALNVPAGVKLRNLYETYLRATVQATRQTFTRVTVDRDSYDGWITTLNLTRDANNEFFTTFSFTMVAFRRTHEKDGSAQALLKTFDAVAGQTQKPLARMKAEVAASVGACQPVWYVNGARSSAAEVVTISEDDGGLARLRNLRAQLKSESGGDTAIGGTCKLTASVGGKPIELSAVGIPKSILNLTSVQSVFTDDVVYRALFDLAAGKNSVLLEVTASGTESAGKPVTAVLSVPLKISGSAKTRISGYKVYRSSDNVLLSTLTFPTKVDDPLKYGEALDDSVAIDTARVNSSASPTTEFGYVVEPLCVDAKTGSAVPAPTDLRLRLSFSDAPDSDLDAKLEPLNSGKLTITKTYLTNLTAVGGSKYLEDRGASGVDLVIVAAESSTILASPRAVLRTRLPIVSAPFVLASSFRQIPKRGSEPGSLSILLAVRPGVDAAAASALALRYIFAAPPDSNGFSATLDGRVGGVVSTPSATYAYAKPTTKAFTFNGVGFAPNQVIVVVKAAAANGAAPLFWDYASVSITPPLGIPAPSFAPASFASVWQNIPT